jgi:magnesium chelatase accessory protein
MNGNLSWTIDGRTWPHRAASRFVAAGGLEWHVQEMGRGPAMVLLHGTGASTHSFRALAPFLAEDHRVLMFDLPGHGFTHIPPRLGLTLPRMAKLVAALAEKLGATAPAAVIGHSAGAAIAARWLIDSAIEKTALVSLNGALLPFNHMGAHTLPAAVKLLFVNPLSVRLATWRAADPQTVANLITGTGSALDSEGLALYGRLFRSRAHVAATLQMMANWELQTLKRDLPKLKAPLTLIVGERDKAVPPQVAQRVAALVPGAHIVVQKRAGHLSHEEHPAETAAIIREALKLGKAA